MKIISVILVISALIACNSSHAMDGARAALHKHKADLSLWLYQRDQARKAVKNQMEIGFDPEQTNVHGQQPQHLNPNQSTQAVLARAVEQKNQN
jgi:hypothetical protein